MDGKDKMLRLMESLCYEKQVAVERDTAELGNRFVQELKATPADKMEGRKGDVMQVHNAVKYLVKFGRMPKDAPLASELAGIIKAQGWEKKKR